MENNKKFIQVLELFKKNRNLCENLKKNSRNLKLSEEEEKIEALISSWDNFSKAIENVEAENRNSANIKSEKLKLSLNSIIVITERYFEWIKQAQKYLDNINGTNVNLLSKLNDSMLENLEIIKTLIDSTKNILSDSSLEFEINHTEKIYSKYLKNQEVKRLMSNLKNLQNKKDKKTKKMAKNRFFAQTNDDISKAAVDFFSLGHILMGQITFFIVYALLVYVPEFDVLVGSPAAPKMWAFIVAVVIGLIWEPIENIVLWKLGLKFENKRDSVLNLVFDILFVTGGAALAYFIENWKMNLILVIVEFTLFFIIRGIFAKKD